MSKKQDNQDREDLRNLAAVNRAMVQLREGLATGVAGYFTKLLALGFTRDSSRRTVARRAAEARVSADRRVRVPASRLIDAYRRESL